MLSLASFFSYTCIPVGIPPVFWPADRKRNLKFLLMPLKKVLIVDDALDICMLLSHYLKNEVPEVVFKTTIAEALEAAGSFQPDVVFLDNSLPDGLGIAHIAEFKSISPCRIFVISANSGISKEAIDLGADHFFEKPLSFTDINKVLKGEYHKSQPIH